MILLSNFQDFFSSLPLNTVLCLPVYKENSLKLSFENNDDCDTLNSGSRPPLPFANSEVFNASIIDFRHLTAEEDDCKTVYEVTFDVKGSNFNFKGGDAIGIIPNNNETDVNFIISHLDLTNVDLVYKLTSEKGKIPSHIPVKSTLRYVLQHCVDLRCMLKKLFLLALSKYTKDENERKILEYISSKEGSNIYQTQILNRNLCIIDIFTIFKSCKPPIQVLLANLPRLLPRPYSIVNSGQHSPHIIKICFSVLLLENNRKGLTTGWLESLLLNEECRRNDLKTESHVIDLENKMSDLKICCDIKIPMYLRKNINNFCLPENLDKGIILIGPGTGVSPFIGFLEEIEYKQANLDHIVGDIWLFFGCRNPDLDFIYEKELKGFLSRGVLTKLFTAFSRLDKNGIKYIQDAIKQNSTDVAIAIKSGASVFICGDVKNMATQVKDIIIQCLIDAGNTKEEADSYIAVMQKENRYVVDVWS